MYTVIGAFNDRRAAEHTADALRQSGFPSDAIDVQGRPDSGAAAQAASESTRARVSHDDTSFAGGMKSFFASLFDNSRDSDVGIYSEAIRRGNAIVVVDAADENQAQKASEVMREQGGTIDLDERSEAWREEGWLPEGSETGRMRDAANFTDEPPASPASGIGEVATDPSLSQAGGSARSRLTGADTVTSMITGAGIASAGMAGTIVPPGASTTPVDGDQLGADANIRSRSAGPGTRQPPGQQPQEIPTRTPPEYTPASRPQEVSPGATPGTVEPPQPQPIPTGTPPEFTPPTVSRAGRESASRTRAGAASGEVVMPVVEEDVRIGKRTVQRGGVRVIRRTTETPISELVRLREEHARIERRPANRPASSADFADVGEDSIEVREVREEPVVEKRARVVEEVVVGREVGERTQRVEERARRSGVEVERLDASSGATPGDAPPSTDAPATSGGKPRSRRGGSSARKSTTH